MFSAKSRAIFEVSKPSKRGKRLPLLACTTSELASARMVFLVLMCSARLWPTALLISSLHSTLLCDLMDD